MKDVVKTLKKHWITIWLIAVALILGIFVSNAVYTEVSTVKRVVTTKSAPKVLFSSNCMRVDIYERRMPAEEFHVTVCNYDQNIPDVPNQQEIEYILTAQLWVKYGEKVMTFSELQGKLGENSEAYNAIVARATGYKIGKTQDNNVEHSIESPSLIEFTASNNFEVTFGNTTNYEKLPGGQSSTDRFKVVVPSRDFQTTDPEFYVYVKAEPTDAGLPERIQTLLYGSQNVMTTALWSGTLAERSTNTLDYDFYNYVITGSGSGRLDIMWDPNWFEVNEFFFNSSLSGVTFYNNVSTPSDVSEEGHVGWKKVTIVVDSSGENAKSRYELQLFKVKEDTSYTGDNDAANHITCVLR